MESFFSRYKNELVLVGVLFIQVIVLASNVERDNPRSPASGRVSLIRVWTVNVITPVERALVSTGHFFRDAWRSYVDLHDVRRQNRQLQEEVDRLRTEQARFKENVSDAQRLKALLEFKERFVGQTVAAQVIGTSGSEQSRVIYIDKGSSAGIKPDMGVITPDGIVGKVKEVFAFSSQVLMVTDHDSGAGVILEKSRLQGILHGAGLNDLIVSNIMADEKVEPGEQIITSGGDRVFPKGLPVGAITASVPDRENAPFLAIKVKPAADLSRLEEVLVITKIAEQSPEAPETSGRVRAADILSERLPAVPKKDTPETGEKPETAAGAGTGDGTPRKPVLPGAQPRNAITGGKPIAPVPDSGAPEVKPLQQKKAAPPPGVVKKPPAADGKKPVTDAPVRDGGTPEAKPLQQKKAAPPPGTVKKPPAEDKKKPVTEAPPQ
jgi:rod shape-determining protein MreC